MSSGRPPLSVIVPVFNEEKSVEEMYGRLAEVLPQDAEMIFVDDGSTDATPATLARLSRDDSRLRWIRFRRNSGKSRALAAGFRRAHGSLLATIDGDLQEDPAALLKLTDKIAEGFDVAWGWRRRRQDPRSKVLVSRLFNLLVNVLGGVRFRDINCGLKVFRREALEEVHLAAGFHRFLPLLAHWRGFRTVEIEIEHCPRRHGKSRYGGERFLRGLLDLVVILFLVRYQGRPGRYFVALGGLAGAAGMTISTYLAWLRLATGSIQSRFPLLALGLVLLIVGVQLFSLGLFGELLAYHFRSQRPLEPAMDEVVEPPSTATPAAKESEGATPDGASGELSATRREDAS